MSGASRSATLSLEGCFPVRSEAKARSRRQGVAVGGDGLAAGVPLPSEPVGEERLQDGGEVGHGRSSQASRRRPAAAMSSGDAVRYQYVAFGFTWPR